MPLSAGADQNQTTNRTLNKLHHAITDVAADITTGATGDIVLMFDASDNYEPKYADAANVAELLGATTADLTKLNELTATSAEINRSTDASARIVATTVTALSLTVTQHGERIVLVNTNSTVANTFTLPAATGTGVKFHVINNIVQTQGSVVVAAAGTDVLTGKALAFDSTAVTAQAEVFLTSASSDKVTFNLTTTGGLGYDEVVAYDVAAATWLVEVKTVGSGNLATPFSET